MGKNGDKIGKILGNQYQISATSKFIIFARKNVRVILITYSNRKRYRIIVEINKIIS